jgi:GNAT superfamily N-acetyltransferase
MGIEPSGYRIEVPEFVRYQAGSDEVVVRRLTENDSIQELTELLHSGYRKLLEMGLRYSATYQDEKRTAERIFGKQCYLGLVDDRMMATITLDPPGTTKGCPYYERSDICSFHQFCVAPEYQGRGIGSFLIGQVERRAVELGAVEMAIDTAEQAQHLIDMYKHHGYRLVDRVKWDTTNYESVVLAKSLSPIH